MTVMERRSDTPKIELLDGYAVAHTRGV